MILFRRDWGKLKTPAVVDYQTTNKSFLRLVSLYREMGLKNCLFPLVLLQPALRGVDPYDPNLTDEQKVMIGIECRYNFWYFLREVVRIPAQGGSEPIKYKANRGNIALSWVFMNNIDSALIQPRQTGKSVSTDCIMVWVLYIGAINTNINMITKDHTLRTKNVERLKKIRDQLPSYLLSVSKRDSDNQTDLTYKSLDNMYITGVGQTSESAANNLGRGLTSPISHIDEGPFIRYIGVTIPAALASGTAAREEAKLNNRPYGNIFTTTAGKKDDRDGKYMYHLIHGGTVWNEIYMDADNREQLVQMLKRNASGRKLIVNITMSHKQLGYTDEWLYEAITTAGASGDEANRDFFNIWTSGTESSPLSPKLNDIIRESEMDPLHNEISRDLYIIRWYKPDVDIAEFMANNPVIIGLDTSEAIGRDSIGMVFTDPTDLSVVASATINETNLIRFSNFLAEIMIKYPKTILVPERKSTGQMIVDSLLLRLPSAGIDPFRRIYNTIVDRSDENPKDFRELHKPITIRPGGFYDRNKKSFGFTTTGGSRELLYTTVLQNAAKEAGHLVHDKTLSAEIRGLVVKNGRIDHASSGHDDMVISWMLTHWFLRHTRNLSFYGIDISKAFTGVKIEGRTLSPEEEYKREEQQRIKTEIEEIYEALSEAANEYLVVQYENRLKALSSRLSVEEMEASSIEALIQQAQEKRQHNARRRNAQMNGGVRQQSPHWSRPTPNQYHH